MPMQTAKGLSTPVLNSAESVMGRPESFKSSVRGEPAELPRNRQDHIQPLLRGLRVLNLGRLMIIMILLSSWFAGVSYCGFGYRQAFQGKQCHLVAHAPPLL